MDFSFEALPKGGQITAFEGDDKLGFIRWKVTADGTWEYTKLHVLEGHQREGVGTALAREAAQRRQAEGVGWVNSPATRQGRAWIDAYIAADFDGIDPREGADHV